jgi:hypothetical protein
MQTQEEFQQAVTKNIQILQAERNQDLRDCYQAQLNYLQQCGEQGIQPHLQQLWITYVESYESNIVLQEATLSLSQYLQHLVDYYAAHTEQRQDMMQIFLNFEKIDQAYRFPHAVGRGIRVLKTACAGIDQAELVNLFLQRTLQIQRKTIELIQLMNQHAAYLYPEKMLDYAALKTWARQQLRVFSNTEKADLWYWLLTVLLEIRPQNLETRVLNHYDKTVLHQYFFGMFLVAIEDEDITLFEERSFILLIEQFLQFIKLIRDRRLIQLITKMVSQKAKRKQLSQALIAVLKQINFVQLSHFGFFPTKQLEKYQQKIHETVQHYQSPVLNEETVATVQMQMLDYQLPFSDEEAAVGAFLRQGNARLAWVAVLQKEFDALAVDEKQQWYKFWKHVDAVSSAKPTKKWLLDAEKIWQQSPVIQNHYLDQLQHWWTVMKKHAVADTRPFNSKNENTLKGIVWFQQFQKTRQDELLNVLTLMSEYCYRKIAGVGATSAVLGGVCLHALAQHGLTGLAKLSFLQKKIRYELGQKVIRKALNEAAVRNHLTVDEIKEVVAEDFDFIQGKSIHPVAWGDYQLGLHCVGDTQCEVWIESDQQVAASTIKGLTSSSVYKDLKKQAALIARQIKVYALGFEEALLQERHWSYGFWQQYVAGHGILGWLAGRLIWQLELQNSEQVIGCYQADTQHWLDVRQQVITVNADQIKSLRLWHPIEATLDEVKAWREYILIKQIQQPFRQAFREVYIATETELKEQQSLRFAYHYLQQSKFRAVATGRAWNYEIQGGWDNVSLPSRYFPAQGIIAILAVDFPKHSTLLNEQGVYAYIKTQEIKFSTSQGQLIDLNDVPKLIFSEVMRDADYFIQGCSIGLDYALELTGFPEEMQRYYSQRYQSTLSQIIVNRHDSLDHILSRLDIAYQCRLDSHFVYVQGQLHEYKIHLGTGHIFMSPNDQFICIVPQQKLEAVHVAHLFLPFEDDAMLSLILSKVLLLAQDHQIKDELIQQQIKVA